MFGNVSLNYKFNPWLTADFKLGSDFYSFYGHGFDEIGTRGGGNTTSQTLGGVIEYRNDVRNINSYFNNSCRNHYLRVIFYKTLHVLFL